MKFKEFADWCNQRACDGYWGMNEAMVCCDICSFIYKQPFWRREKTWKVIYEKTVVNHIVEPINKKIEEYLK